MSARSFIVVALVAVAVVGVLTTALRHPDTRVGKVTVVVPRRDLHDSGPIAVRRTPVAPRKRAGKQTTRRSGPSTSTSLAKSPQSPTRTGARTAPLPSRRRQTPKTKRDHHPSRPRPQSGSPSPTPAPPPSKQCPPVTLTVPAPVTAQVGPVAVNC